jgi:hypothetical protein
MKFNRSIALITAATLMLAACGKDEEEAAAGIRENTNPLLVHAPAESAYVFANLEVVPKDIIDSYVARFQPVIDSLNDEIAQFQADYASGEYADDSIALFASSVLEELGNQISLENLENLGISPQSFHAVYAVGAFPVARMELSNEEALRQAIGRIEAKMGFSLPVMESNGVNYWRIADDDTPVGLYITLHNRQLALGVFPVSAEAQLLPAFLGQQLPSTSMASSNALAYLNDQKGYSGFGSGFIDFRKLAQEFMATDSATRQYLGPDMAAHLDSLSDVCISEINSMIAMAPRMTAGTTALTANEMSVRYELEIENTLAAGLAALVSDTPPAEEGDFLVSASLAIKVGKLRNFLVEKASNVVASPYQCDKLQDLNGQAEQLVEQLNIPMPPMINNLEGLRIRMDDFDPNAGMDQGSGLLALHVDKPEMFVGMASMLVPGFDTLDLANRKDPVQIPEDMIPMVQMEVFALMSDKAIGIAAGAQQSGELKPFLKQESDNDGTLLSVSYDMARQMEIQRALSQNMDISGNNATSADNELYETLQTTYGEILGRSRFEIRLTSGGMQFDSKMTFK